MRVVRLRSLGLSAVLAGVLLVAFVVVMRLAVRGAMPALGVALIAPVLLLAIAALVFRPKAGAPHGFGLFTLGTLIALPSLGASGLIDPWETHYAEVAREMIERRDLISPWWANEGWFMSKPVLLFWLEALSMKVFGAGTGPDQVLSGAGGALAHPEWAVRFPGFVLAIAGSQILYWGVARTCGRLPAFLGGLVLCTMPGFALLSHQAITDMPLVSGVAASIGLLLGALSTSDAVLVPRWIVLLRKRSVEVHAGHAVALLITLATFSQIAIVLGQPHFLAGSPHACTLPNQPPCLAQAFAHPRLTPLLQAAIWTFPTAWLVMRAAEERRAVRLMMLGAWAFAALAAMAKGPAGLVVPALAALGHAVARRDPRSLLRMELVAGLVLAGVMIGPWYLAVYARHGRGFIDELVLRNMLGRTLDHLHDTNEGDDVGIVYFVRQLGYATFPWSGLALASTLAAAREHDRSRRTIARVVLSVATLGAFALVSMMRTKFHHYVLLVLPSLAMLVGIELDGALSIAKSSTPDADSPRHAWTRATMIGAALVVIAVGRDLVTERGPASFILLLTYRYARSWPSTRAYSALFAGLAIAAASAVVAMAFTRVRLKAALGLGGVAVVLAALLVDSYVPRCASDGGQRGVLAAYYRDRASGDSAPLVAYQLNWKGENFYTGNHLAIFISSGAPMKSYLDLRRARDERTVYFVTERGRVKGLRNELGTVRSFAELTDASVSAEYTLVRASL